MRDAIGGLMSIWIIIIFIVLVNGYLAFSANYSKAYNYKNRIINQIEQYDGVGSGTFLEELKTYKTKLGYSMTNDYPASISGIDVTNDASDGSRCVEKYTCLSKEYGFCYKCTEVVKASTAGKDDGLKKRTYTVVTYVNIDIPIINKISPAINFFRVMGDSAPITIRG